jgi:Tfp pilus assembly protein PilP
VKAPNERNFILKVGAAVGQHGGLVTAITESKVIVSEPHSSQTSDAAHTIKELLLKRDSTAEQG